MKGHPERQPQLFYPLDLEQMVPADHPLRPLKRRVDAELAGMRRAFAAAYSPTGRPSIPPEQLIKATLLQALYSIRSERQLCEQIQYNMLYRWFLDMAPDTAVWDHSSFTTNRERFAEHDLLGQFFRGSVAQGIREGRVSAEHFSVDGTLIQAWASMKSFRPKDPDQGDPPTPDGGSNRWVNGRGEKRSNHTHESRTDPQARLFRKGNGQSAVLAHMGHVLMENRNGLVVELAVTRADGLAEREAAKTMLERAGRIKGLHPVTLGADTGYGDGEFLWELEHELKVQPHIPSREVPQVIDDPYSWARWQAHRRRAEPGYGMSQRIRKCIEEIFGWLKTTAGAGKARFVGRWKIRDYLYGAAAIWNLMRLSKLAAA